MKNKFWLVVLGVVIMGYVILSIATTHNPGLSSQQIVPTGCMQVYHDDPKSGMCFDINSPVMIHYWEQFRGR